MSTATSSEPGTNEDATRYLGASIPVICAHLKYEVSVSRARDEIRHAAIRLAADMAGASTKSLVAKLEQATGCNIEQLAVLAERWPASARLAHLDS
jgi:hypothetical protein